MTIRAWVTVATIAVAVTAVAGCTDQSAGSPMPDDTTTRTETNTTTTSASAEPTSERPREITLDGKDPCALIPQTDWPQFEIDGPGNPSEDQTYKSPQCHYSGVGQVTVVVTEGAEAWDDRGQDTNINEVDPIDGYPTITVWNEIDRRSCYAVVDVAEGGYLMATAVQAEPDQETERCDQAYRMAVSAMSTLVAS